MTRSAFFPCVVLALAGCVLCGPDSFAADDGAAQTSATPQSRPRVGLVLAGGGAKGGAHVGVLKALEEMNVPIDCIAGTSMGALVGGGYASGIPAAGLEKFVTGIDWKSVVGGVGRRDSSVVRIMSAGATAAIRGNSRGPAGHNARPEASVGAGRDLAPRARLRGSAHLG